MSAGAGSQESERAPELFPASRGVGPLLQRDYWAVIRRCRLSPAELGTFLATRFADFAPAEWVGFQRPGGESAPLQQGDLIEVHIRGVGDCAVQVIHRNPQSLTLATVRGHPEAGRITFGAYRNRRGDVVIHIRSRARSSSRKNYAGFLGPGDPMQTSTWTDFVNRVAVSVGEGVVGYIRADTRRIADEDEEHATHAPTYEARGN